MNTQRIAHTLGCAIVGIGFAAAATACSSTGAPAEGSAAASSTPSATAPATPAGAAAPIKATEAADLGVIVVTADGKTVYALESDTPTTSACTGKCAQNWPIVAAPDPLPASIAGVTGTVGELVLPDGRHQLTLNGHPLYTFAGDQAAGQYNGRGKQFADGRWGIVAATGQPAY